MAEFQTYRPSSDLGVAEQALREIAMLRPLGKCVPQRGGQAYAERVEAIAIDALDAIGAPLGEL